MFNYGSGGAARGAAAQATSQQVDRHPGLGLGFANLMGFFFSYSYMAGVSCEERVSEVIECDHGFKRGLY